MEQAERAILAGDQRSEHLRRNIGQVLPRDGPDGGKA